MNVTIINKKEAVNLKENKELVVNGGGWKEER